MAPIAPEKHEGTATQKGPARWRLRPDQTPVYHSDLAAAAWQERLEIDPTQGVEGEDPLFKVLDLNRPHAPVDRSPTNLTPAPRQDEVTKLSLGWAAWPESLLDPLIPNVAPTLIRSLELAFPRVAELLSVPIAEQIARSLPTILPVNTTFQGLGAISEAVRAFGSLGIQDFPINLGPIASPVNVPQIRFVEHVAHHDSASRRAVEAVRDLQDWLGVSVAALAAALGTSRSAILYWKRASAAPRPATARKLYRLHALLRSLRRVSGQDDFVATLNRQVEPGQPTVLELVLGGDYERLERAVRPMLFNARPELRPRLGHELAPRDDEVPEAHADAPASQPLSPPVRRSQRPRLTQK